MAWRSGDVGSDREAREDDGAKMVKSTRTLMSNDVGGLRTAFGRGQRSKREKEHLGEARDGLERSEASWEGVARHMLTTA